MTVQALFEWEPARDQWGRPKITTPTGEVQAYTRASTLAKALDKGEGLTKWKQRQTALGMAARPDLVALLASTREGDNKTVDRICEDALVASMSQLGANLGTALHSFTETWDRGEEPKVPAELQPDIEAYKRATAGLQMEMIEQFVVQDELRCAGTFDRTVRVDGQLYVADIKTGQHEPRYPHSAAVQTAVYARGTLYGENGRSSSLADLGVNQDRALLIWLPSRQAKCELYWLDIQRGWSMARVAVGVRRWHSSKPITPVVGTINTKENGK